MIHRTRDVARISSPPDTSFLPSSFLLHSHSRLLLLILSLPLFLSLSSFLSPSLALLSSRKNNKAQAHDPDPHPSSRLYSLPPLTWHACSQLHGDDAGTHTRSHADDAALLDQVGSGLCSRWCNLLDCFAIHSSLPPAATH